MVILGLGGKGATSRRGAQERVDHYRPAVIQRGKPARRWNLATSQKNPPPQRGEVLGGARGGGIGGSMPACALNSRRHQGFWFTELQRNFTEAPTGEPFRPTVAKENPARAGVQTPPKT
jgi:hypothetical protein